MVAVPAATPVTNPDWSIFATLGLSLPQVPVPGLVVLSDILTVAVICSVFPTTIVEWSEVTVTPIIVGGVGGGVGVVGVVELSFPQENIKQSKTRRPEDKINLFMLPPLFEVR